MTSTISKLLQINRPKIYTISDRQCKPYTIQISKSHEKPELTKTTLIAFRNETDAFEMAYLLETHKRNRNEWPNNIFETATNSGFSLYGDIRNIQNVSLVELKIENWTDNTLQNYCAKNILDVLYIYELDKTEQNKYTIKGQLHKIEADIQYYIQILNNKINQEDDDYGDYIN